MIKYNNLLYKNKDFTSCCGVDTLDGKIVFHPNTRTIEANSIKSFNSKDDLVFPKNLELVQEYAFLETHFGNIESQHKIRIKTGCFENSTFKNILLHTETIPNRCFRYSKMEDVKLYDVKVLQSDSFYKANIKNILLPSTLRTIKSRAFYDCKIENNIFKVPESVKYIEDYALCFKNIDAIVLPAHLTFLDPSFAGNVTIITDFNTIDRFPCLKRYNTQVLSVEELIEQNKSFKEINSTYKEFFR